MLPRRISVAPVVTGWFPDTLRRVERALRDQLEDSVDTEAIAAEIVAIRNRLDEMSNQVEGSAGADADDERIRLEERLLSLQDQLSAHGTDDAVDEPGGSDTLRFVPPA